MKVGINKQIIGKAGNQTGISAGKANHLWTEYWTRPDLNINELAEEIKNGHGFGPWFKDAGNNGGYRSKENLICTQVLAVDIDNKDDQRQWTLSELVAFPFVMDHAGFIYTTATHSPENPRYRIVFALETELTDPEHIRAAYKALVAIFESDEATTAPAQCFYGSPQCHLEMVGKVLSDATVHALIRTQSAVTTPTPSRAKQKAATQSGNASAAVTPTFWIAEDTPVRCAGSSEYHHLNELQDKQKVHCPDPAHPDKSASAQVIRPAKRGVSGVYCFAHKRWYPVKRKFQLPEDPADKFWREQVDIRVGSPASATHFFDLTFDWRNPNEKLLDSLPSGDAIVLIKSPKGTGKTEVLKRLVDDTNKTVLVIGHRILLLREIAQRLSLDLYEHNQKPVKPTNKYAVTVDSLANRLRMDTPARQYHTVILDEVEQVISHMLSDTDSLVRGRFEIVKYLIYVVKHAKRLILSDADLGPNVEVLLKTAGRIADLDTAVIIHNRPKGFTLYNRTIPVDSKCEYGAPKIALYESESDLQEKMLSDYRDGTNLFVCCNSKKKAELIHGMLTATNATSLPVLLVTSDTRNTPAVIDFMIDPKKKFWDYSAIVSSPSLGSGVDLSLSFPSDSVGSPRVAVYGYFINGVNSHTDIDQHLGRVRNPTQVLAWVSPEERDEESRLDEIKKIIRERDVSFRRLTALDEYGYEMELADDPTLDIYAQALSVRNQSMRYFRKNFIRYKKNSGWVVDEIAATEQEHKELKALKKRADENLREEKSKRILSARKLDSQSADILRDARRSSGGIPDSEQAALDRYYLERFYCAEATAELIDLDDESRFQPAVERFECLMVADKALMQSDVSEVYLFPADREARLYTSRTLGQLLGALGLADIQKGNLPENWETCHDNLNGFREVVEDMTDADFSVMGLKKRKDIEKSPMITVTRVLASIGLKTKKTRRTSSEGDERTIWYGIDADSFAKMLGIANRRKDARTQVGVGRT
ncbi:plasmid replication protein, CyRepA1 family [Stenotrophobium rhamnosiphilum]|uniref:Replication origin-binding protein domain-containing protein n=1 Tax=Stenotrophobium rhamnosiphilum TaxID=2029166 RepID=A0A2T5MB27_9GAMM|nr:plasmid replication protein, CyRepA1 family [Stenotrophobium rhamnosiphilum]PTU28211.1 hypothetical protein CJD38_17835 [Stenotrophobium rhamnosiphilum]